MQSKLSSCREDLVKSKDTIATLEIRNKLLTEKILIAEPCLQEIVPTNDDKYDELARRNEILRAELHDSQNAVDRLNVDKEKLQEDFFQSLAATKNSFEKEITIKVSELEALKVIQLAIYVFIWCCYLLINILFRPLIFHLPKKIDL